MIDRYIYIYKGILINESQIECLHHFTVATDILGILPPRSDSATAAGFWEKSTMTGMIPLRVSTIILTLHQKRRFFCVTSCTSSTSAFMHSWLEWHGLVASAEISYIQQPTSPQVGEYLMKKMSSTIPDNFFRLEKYCSWKLMEYKESFTSPCKE